MTPATPRLTPATERAAPVDYLWAALLTEQWRARLPVDNARVIRPAPDSQWISRPDRWTNRYVLSCEASGSSPIHRPYYRSCQFLNYSLKEGIKREVPM